MQAKPFPALKIKQQVRIGQSVNHTEEQRKEIDQGQLSVGLHIAEEQVVDGGCRNGERNQELDPANGHFDMTGHAQYQRNAVPNGESRYQNGNFSPVAPAVTKA